jgi:hypothetical protein
MSELTSPCHIGVLIADGKVADLMLYTSLAECIDNLRDAYFHQENTTEFITSAQVFVHKNFDNGDQSLDMVHDLKTEIDKSGL